MCFFVEVTASYRSYLSYFDRVNVSACEGQSRFLAGLDIYEGEVPYIVLSVIRIDVLSVLYAYRSSLFVLICQLSGCRRRFVC